MENPATWGKPEHVINKTLREIENDLLTGISQYGLSDTYRIAQALRRAGFLREEPVEPDQ